MTQNDPAQPNPTVAAFPAMIGSGVAIGVALGLVFDNLALGIGIGMAIGAALGSLSIMIARRKQQD
ncbi:hypothetical protein [Nonomuraea soli]|uniref:Putative membrane protein n=1 Tax=Nonomuraea soli TaxID=1032476 RepID=A0A7W0CI77_9ACTN|nr:hypothetical protein [Nonomuraea soli]MBA2891649.1 putative membrane protein [Nonomuraea soli]